MAKKTKNFIPEYIPFYYKIFLKLRKVWRQTTTRQFEKKTRENKVDPGLIPDGEVYWAETQKEAENNPVDHINKCAAWMQEDLNLPYIKPLVEKFEALKTQLNKEKLYFTNAAGTFLPHVYTDYNETKKMWENVWCYHHSGIKPGEKVLDLAGASTIFSFYLASIGCDVTVIDNDWGNCGTIYNTNYVAKKKGWNLKGLDRNLSQPIPFPDNTFDHVFCICVVEHIPSFMRQFVMKEIHRVLKPGRLASLTTDFDHERPVLVTDKGLRFAYRDKFNRDIVDASDLKLHGNEELIDVNPNKDFLGAFFLSK